MKPSSTIQQQQQQQQEQQQQQQQSERIFLHNGSCSDGGGRKSSEAQGQKMMRKIMKEWIKGRNRFEHEYANEGTTGHVTWLAFRWNEAPSVRATTSMMCSASAIGVCRSMESFSVDCFVIRSSIASSFFKVFLRRFWENFSILVFFEIFF